MRQAIVVLCWFFLSCAQPQSEIDTSIDSRVADTGSVAEIDDMALLQNCAEMTLSSARLDCYDELAGRVEPNNPIPAVPSPWQLTDNTDPMDDTRSIMLTNFAKVGRYTLGLSIRCRGGDLSLLINWGRTIYSSSSSPRVMLRVDDQEARTSPWKTSTDRRITFYPGPTERFIEDLMRADQLAVRTRPRGATPITAIFEMGDLEQKIKPIRQACNW